MAGRGLEPQPTPTVAPTPTPAVTITPLVTPVLTPTAVAPTSTPLPLPTITSWKEYKLVNFVFKCPADWYATNFSSGKDRLYIFSDTDPRSYDSLHGPSYNQIRIDVVVESKNRDEILIDWAKKRHLEEMSYLPTDAVEADILEIDTLQLNDLEVVRYSLKGNRFAYFFENQSLQTGAMVEVYFGGERYRPIFDQILSTFKFLD